MRRLVVVVLIIITGSIFNSYAFERLLQPYNLSFEQGVPGSIPEAWYMASKFQNVGFRAYINNTNAVKGKHSLQFDYIGKADTIAIADTIDTIFDPYGYVYQTVDGKDFRGKKVKFKVALFTENLQDSSNCRLRLTTHFIREKDKPSQNFISDSIVFKNGWNYYEVTGEIDKEADLINYGILLTGNGSVLIDDVTIEFEKGYIGYNETELRDLKPQELINLSAFGKLLGCVRYFYPGFESVESDWEKFALKGVQYVESSENTNELTERLEELFLPVAPGIQISTNKYSETKKTKPPEAFDNIALSWLHIGAPVGIPIKNFSNDLKNIFLPTRQREAPAIQIVDASPFKGKKIKLSCFVKTAVEPPAGHAQLWLGIDDKQDNVAVFKSTIENAPIIAQRWTEYSLDVDVPENASVIRLGLVMLGEGKVWFDQVKLQIVENNKLNETNYARNSGFEEKTISGMLLSWTFPETAIKAGYDLSTSEKEKYEGKFALQITSDDRTKITMPKINEHLQFEIANGIRVNMPLNCFIDSSGTLPQPSDNYKLIPPYKPDDFIVNANDRYSRFAVTILLWNINRHFAIGINPNLNWESILETALKDASQVQDEDFINTLNRMLAQINDGQARAWLNRNETIYGLPVFWQWVGNELIVYQNYKEKNNIPAGSVVKKINGTDVEDLVEQLMKTITGNTKQWRKLRASAILRGSSVQDSVDIEVITHESKVETYKLKRNIDIQEMTEIRPPAFHIYDDDKYYIDLTRLTDRGLKNLVNDFKDRFPKANILVFDLRGFASVSEEFLGMFIKNKIPSVSRKYPIFTRPGGRPNTFYEIGSEILPRNPFIKTNTYFLIDERSSGGAEVIAGLVKHYRMGILVGSTSSGTADEVFGINLPGEFNASMVTMLTVLNNSKIDFKKGIEPDITILHTKESLSKGEDIILEYIDNLNKK